MTQKLENNDNANLINDSAAENMINNNSEKNQVNTNAKEDLNNKNGKDFPNTERSEEITIRPMKEEDYDKVRELWQTIGGFGIRSIDDSREDIVRFIRRNPDTSVVAQDPEGKIRPLLEDSECIYAYERLMDDKVITVACNWTQDEQDCSLFDDLCGEELISNYAEHKKGKLQPYEARVILH